MNKKFILLLSIIFVIGLVFFVSSRREGENLDGSVYLTKGWNLVTHYTFRIDPFEGEKSNEENISAIFIYNGNKKEYIEIYPNFEKDKLDELISQIGDIEKGGSIYEYGWIVNSAMWVYSENNQLINFTTLDGPLFPEHVGLKAGWNLLAVTPELVGKEIREIKGNCSIQRSYFWNSLNQEWREVNYFREEMLWYGIITKVSSDCILGRS